MIKQQRQKHTPLEQLRRDRDWSYARLGREIERVTGLVRTDSGWFRICSGRVSTPRGPTQQAIDRFLAAMKRKGENTRHGASR